MSYVLTLKTCVILEVPTEITKLASPEEDVSTTPIIPGKKEKRILLIQKHSKQKEKRKRDKPSEFVTEQGREAKREV